MKRNKLFLFCVVVFVIALGVSACKSVSVIKADTSVGTSESNPEADICPTKSDFGAVTVAPGDHTYPIEISRGSNYLITRESSFVFRYQILDPEGQVVRERILDGKEPQISVLEHGVLDISVGYGTGLIEHTYYDVKRDLFSDPFFYVVANSDGGIAFIDVPEDGGI